MPLARLSPPRERRSGPRFSVAKPLAVFAAAGLAAVVLLGLVATSVLRHTARREAIRDAKEITRLAGVGIAEPAVSESLLTGDARARARFGRLMDERVLREPVVRVKLWTLDGRIVFSDEPRLVGRRFGLEPDELAAVRRGIVDSDVSDLERPENRFERRFGKLLEVYLPIDGPDGSPLLFEDYLRFSSVTESERRILSRFAPALLGILALLWLAQLPLAASITWRLRQRQREREALLKAAIDSSDLERRRIAEHLHDGVVQDLAGVSYSLAATADRLEHNEREGASGAVADAAAATRRAIRELRALLVGIYPASLRRSGLGAALSDLVAPLTARGIAVDVNVPDDLALPPAAEDVLFRGAQEALRNVEKHAQPTHVGVGVVVLNGKVTLTVSDDGRGFVPVEGPREEDGHFGLRLLDELAAECGGRLDIDSAVGKGTTLRMEVPIE
jgi:two-component system NarL family sensor kinase